MDNIKEIISNSDCIISFGTFLAADNLEIQESIIESIAKNESQFIYMHPIDNIDLKVYYSQFIKYEVGSEEGVASLLLDTFVKQSSEEIQEYIDDLDIGYISAESSAGEEEFEEILEKSNHKKNKVLIIGRDVLLHERSQNIAKILHIIEKYSDLKIVSLDLNYQKVIDEAFDNAPQEPEDLHSYNGTVVYRIYGNKEDTLIGSESFARIAKIKNEDDIYLNYKGEKFQRKFLIDKNLYGTIALCSMKNEDTSILSQGYRYKQVKIEKVDA